MVEQLLDKKMKLFSKKESGNINSWPDRMVLYAILATVKSLLESATPEPSFFGHSADDSLKVISQAIKYYLYPDKTTYPDEVELLFAPTGALQELSISNGWGEVYLKLSAEFDRTICCLKHKK